MSFPDGYNCDKMLGEDNADNAQSTSNVVANEDGSILERLEHLKQTNNNLVKKVLTTTANGDTTLFNYTGCVRIKAIFGVITTVMQNKAQNIKLSVVADALVAYDICANKDVDTFAVGSVISITGTAANAAVSTTGVGAIAPLQAGDVLATCITSGLIKMVSGAANTGAITWYVQWEPLSAGATLTAA